MTTTDSSTVVSPQLRDRLARLIPFEPRPAKDGKFGWGFDLLTDPIPPQVYDQLLIASIETRTKQAKGLLGTVAWEQLGQTRQDALVEILFYISADRARSELRNVLSSLRKQNWKEANRGLFQFAQKLDYYPASFADAAHRLTSGMEPS